MTNMSISFKHERETHGSQVSSGLSSLTVHILLHLSQLSPPDTVLVLKMPLKLIRSMQQKYSCDLESEKYT